MNIKISFSFLLITIISFSVLYPVLGVGLYGDDWLAIFRYVVHVMSPSKEGWNLFTYYLTPYGSQDIIMGLLYLKFGTNAYYFEVTALILRLLAAFSLFPLVFYLTKSRLATFFAILFFSITTTGFDSTGWLLTMSTYLTIAFFNLFLYFYILFHDKGKLKFLLISGLWFYLAYITASARMIGVPMFILTLEIFWLIKDKTLKGLKSSASRLLFLFSIFFIISTTGHSLGSSSDWFARLGSGITTIQKLISEGRSDFLMYPIVTIGGMFIPNFILPSIQISTKKDMLVNVVLPALTIFSLFLLIMKANATRIKKEDIYKTLVAATIWIAIVFVIRKLNFINFSGSNLILMLTTGGLSILVWILLLVKHRTQKNILDALFISLAWTLSSFFLAWIWSPSSYIDTTHRYLTTSAIGISIFFATIISLGNKLKNKLILSSVLSLFIVLHIISTRTYINRLIDLHGQKTVDKIWTSIPKISEVGKEPLIFYFESDSGSGGTLGDSVLFGFPFHTALLYNLKESDIIPVSMTDWQEVVSAVKDGQSFKSYGYPLEPISIDKVYGFRLQNKDTIINITNNIRQKLAKEK